MLQALDEAPLTRRFYLLAAAVMVGAVLDLFDFFLIAFVVPDLADEWDLTFGQAAAMLLARGWGRSGQHRLGTRRGPPGPAGPLMAGIVMFSLATGHWRSPPRRLVVHRDSAPARRGRRRGAWR